MFTLRHFLFYMAVAATLGTAIGIVHNVFDLSSGLTFVVAAVTATFASTVAIREDLFAPARTWRSQHERRLG